MLHSAQPKTADAAAAKNNPSSAPNPFPHPPGINPLPQEMDIQDYSFPAFAVTAPLFETSGAHPNPRSPTRRSTCSLMRLGITPKDLSPTRRIHPRPRRRPNSGSPHPRTLRDQPRR